MGGDKVQIPSKKSNLWQMCAHTPLPFPVVAGGFAIGRSPSSLPCRSLCASGRGGKAAGEGALQERSGAGGWPRRWAEGAGRRRLALGAARTCSSGEALERRGQRGEGSAPPLVLASARLPMC